MPLIVSVSRLAVDTTSKVTVRLVADTEMPMLLLGMSLLLEVALPTPGLKLQPAGAVKISVRAVPIANSPLENSLMLMLPRVVKPGAAPFWALSADIPVPPVAAVIVTFASALPAQSQQRPPASSHPN